MIHQQIKEQIKDAMRSKDQIRLDTLRGLNALFLNEMISGGGNAEFLADDKVLALIKRSVKQRKDSIEQFEKGGRNDLADKEKAELLILETYLPKMMPYEEVEKIISAKVAELKSAGQFDPKAAGKITGIMMKELAGKADGADVKKAVDNSLK